MGQMGINRQLDLDLRGRLVGVPPVVGDGFTHEPHIEVEADTCDVARLLAAEQVARAADLEVLHGDLHAGAEVGVAGDRLEPVVGSLGEGRLGRVEEVGIGPLPTSTHSAAELVQLREPQPVGTLDDQGVGVGDVQAGFDYRRADEHVELLVPEVQDHLLQTPLGHLAVGRRDPRLGHEFADARGGLLDARHLVVDEEDLPLAQQLTPDRRAHLALVIGADIGEDWVPLLGRRCESGHFAYAGHGHLERARDRRRGHCEHVDVGAHRLELLLVLDAETLLLVDDDQPEVLELVVLGQQAMCPDDQIDRAVGHAVLDRLGLPIGLEARERRHSHRELRIALGEGLEMLLHEQGGRHEDRHLLAVLDRLERRSHCDLGLAVADVAADEPVHRDLTLHVGLDLVDRAQLVGRLDIGEGVLEFALPGGVASEGVAGGRHARGVELDELGRDLLDVATGLALGGLPVRATELVEGGLLATDITGHLIELVRGHEESVRRLPPLGGGVFDDEIFTSRALDGPLHHLDELAHTVLLVDDVIARTELQGVDLVAAARRHPPHVLGRATRGGRRRTGQVGLGDHGESGTRDEEAPTEARRGDVDDPRLEDRQWRLESSRHVRVGEHGRDASRRADPVGDEHDLPALTHPALQVGDGRLRVTPIGGRILGARGDRVLTGLAVDGEGRQVPPGEPEASSVLAEVGHRPVGTRSEHLLEVDRHRVARGRIGPTGLQELLARGHQIMGAGADPLRVEQHDGRVARDDVEEGLHAVEQGGSQGFHALDRDALADLAEHLGRPGQMSGQRLGAGAHLLGEQQLAARRRPQAVLGDLEAALVGDLEPADLLDLVAPELHTHRVVLGRRKDVEDAAADRELTAPLDEVGAVVGRRGESRDDVLHGRGVARPQGHRLEVTQSLGDGLEDGPHRCDDDVERPVCRVARIRVGQPAQDGQASAHCVGTRRKSFVRKGFP